MARVAGRGKDPIASPVLVQWIVKGIPEIVRSSRTVQDTVLAAERNATRAVQREAAARGKIADAEARMKIQALKKSDNEIRRIQEGATRTAERAMQNEVRAFEKAENEKTRIAARLTAQRSRDEQRAAEANQKFFKSITGSAASGYAAGRSRVNGIAGQVGGLVTQLGGGFSVADSVQRSVSLRHEAAVLSASTELAGPGVRKISTKEIEGKARAIGAEQGIDPSEVLKGFDEVKKLTGDLDKAMQIMPGIAKLATATGGKLSEMSGLAANILASNPNISNKELDQQMRVFTRQGVVGGVEVADFAKYGSRLTAGASLFGGDASKNQATLGAMAQMSRQYGGASSAAEASLSSQRFATDVAKHSKQLEAKGIKVSDGKGGLRDAQSILADMVDKTGGDVTKLGSMGLGERGVKALTGVSAIYKNAGGGDKGKEAVKAEFAKYTTGVTEGEVGAANKRVLGEADAKMEQIRQKFDQAISEKLVPKLLELVPVLEKLIPQFVDVLSTGLPAFVEFLKSIAGFADANKDIIKDIASHPIGSIMAFEVGKSIVAANLGEVIKRLMTGGGGGGAGTPGVGGGGAGAAGGAGMAGGLAVAAGGVLQAKFLSDQYSMVTGGDAAAANVEAMAKGGDTAGAQKALAAAQQKAGTLNTASSYVQAAGRVANYVNPLAMLGTYGADAATKKLTGTNQAEQISGQLNAQAIVDSEGVRKAITAAIVAGANDAAKTSPGAPNRSEPIKGRN